MGKRKVTQPQRNAVFFKKSQNEGLWVWGEGLFFVRSISRE